MRSGKKHLIAISFLLAATTATGQEENAGTNNKLGYNIERQISFGNGKNPLWLNANKYGLSSIKSNNGYLRLALDGHYKIGQSKTWELEYGADLATAYNFTSSFIIQQLYTGIKYRKTGIWIGSKERAAHLKNAELSSGSQTFGTNARPIPDIRIETPD